MASPICFRLFWQLARAAASRTFCTAGRSSPIKTAMIAITTSSSIKVKACFGRERRADSMRCPPYGIRPTGKEREQPTPVGHSFQLDVKRLRAFGHRQTQARGPRETILCGDRNDLVARGNPVFPYQHRIL